ncbi:FHA domain-containing protein (plasmid) [Gordonia rubripertincta]|uniref:FHA domain-containing protein n=1 Tax=Gordonia TaxID=2053 RepID=UPI0034DE8A18
MPTVEWIARRVLDKVEQQSPSTLRGKVLPPIATVTVNSEVYEVLESLWHSVSCDLSEAIAATAHAEGWECGEVAFGLRASTKLGRRDVEVSLAYPTSDEVSTSHVPRRARPNGGRRDTEATLLAPDGDAQWFVERSGFVPEPLPRGRDVVIGASAKCDLVVASSVVSRRHLRLRWEAGTNLVEVEDLGSTNGSWLESQRLQPHVPMAVTHDSWLRLSRSSRIRLVLRTGVSRLR